MPPRKKKGKRVILTDKEEEIKSPDDTKSREISPKMEQYLDALNIYFELKKKYNARIKHIKKRILKEDSSWDEKRDKLFREKKCIVCNKPGGTLFTFQNGVYKARCEAKEKRCGLNIEITRPQIVLIPSELSEITKILEFLKQQIIQKKLNLIFGLEDEDTVTTDFNDLRNSFQEMNRHYISLKKQLDQNTMLEEREKLIVQGYKKYYDFVNKFRIAIKEYENTDDNSVLKGLIEIYVNEIQPLQDYIRNNQYSYTELLGDQDNLPFRLIKKKVSYISREKIENPPKVVKLITKPKK